MSICCCCYLYLFTPPFLRTENYISRLISESIVKMSKMSCFDGIRTEMAAEVQLFWPFYRGLMSARKMKCLSTSDE